MGGLETLVKPVRSNEYEVQVMRGISLLPVRVDNGRHGNAGP